MMNFIKKMKKEAKKELKTIVLAEGEDKRVVEAVKKISKQSFAKVIVLSKDNKELDKLKGVRVINHLENDMIETFTEKLVEIRKNKNLSKDEARKLLKNKLYFGVMLVNEGIADGMVAGAANSTANVLKPALKILKTKKGSKIISSFMIMEVPKCKYGENGIFAFSDIGIVPNPNDEELANIGISTANSFKRLLNIEPKVGMLSFSTKGSAEHILVDKVKKATEIIKEEKPTLKIDGELQLDAAIIPEIADKKAPESEVEGKANVLIFPDLNSGNIGYKLVQRLANANAYGPIIQGIKKPVNDLSRGCSIEDIVGVTAITAVQAK